MRRIGITGGIGAGKSCILSYIEQNCNCRILLADDVAHRVKEPGQPCYRALVGILGDTVLGKGGGLIQKVNAIIHPAVKQYIVSEIEKESAEGKKDAFFVEAALLIEEGYGQILDELWYVYANEGVRRQRLQKMRGYSDEKITQIFASQLSEAAFLEHCKVVIDNGHGLSDTYRQIDERLREAGLKK